MPSTDSSPPFSRAKWAVAVVVVLVVTGALVVSGLGAVPTVTGASTYTITVDGSVDVPERTVDFQGDSYQISAIAKADPGETVDVSVDAPSSDDYELYIYNADKQIEDQRAGTGDESFEFTLSGYSAGSYAIVLQHDGSNEKVHPLVIRGYAVTVDAPSKATPDSTINVSVNATKLRGQTLETVDVDVANDDDRVSTTAEYDSGSTYTTNVSLDGLDEGTYHIFGTVRGPDSAFGEDERLGLNDGVELTIEAASTTTETATATDSSGGGGTGGGGGSGTEADTGGSTTTAGTTETTQSPNQTKTEAMTQTSPSADERETTAESTTDPNREATTTTEEGVITPRPTTETSTLDGTTSSSTDGFGVSVTLLAGVCALILWSRYRSE